MPGVDHGPDPKMPLIGHYKQLFLDDFIIDSVKNLSRIMHQPKKYERNPIIKKDRPWEELLYIRENCFDVCYDENQREFKCWYTEAGLQPLEYFPQQERILYARSKDGLDWEKPSLDYYVYKGNGTNRVFGGAEHGGVMDGNIIKDPTEKNPNRRYKMVYLHYRPGLKTDSPKTIPFSYWDGLVGLCLAFSPDGIRWTPYEGNPISKFWGDDVILLTYDDLEGRYNLLTRHPYGPMVSRNRRYDSWFPVVYTDSMSADSGRINSRRRLWQNESKDCINWGTPYPVLEPDEDDNLDETFYGVVKFAVGDLYIGFLQVLHQVENTMDVRLVFSRDGRSWRRACRNYARPFIERGPSGSWDEFMVETSSPPIEVGDEHWIYYGGANIHHDLWHAGAWGSPEHPETKELEKRGHALGLAKLRLDGYVSLHADTREGILTTKPLWSDGKHLIINGKCGKNGYISAEIMDHFDTSWDGYTREDCEAFTGDSVNHVISWKSNNEVDKVPGHIKLRFYLKDADLYSFRIANA